MEKTPTTQKNIPHISLQKPGKENKINNSNKHPPSQKKNQNQTEIRHRTVRLRALRDAAQSGAEQCGARGQGLLRGKTRQLALGRGKGIKTGQDQQARAQRLLRDQRGTLAAPCPSPPMH